MKWKDTQHTPNFQINTHTPPNRCAGADSSFRAGTLTIRSYIARSATPLSDLTTLPIELRILLRLVLRGKTMATRKIQARTSRKRNESSAQNVTIRVCCRTEDSVISVGDKDMETTDIKPKPVAWTRPNTCSCGAISYPEYENCVGEEEVLCPICGCVVLRVRLRDFRDEDTFDLPKKKRKFCTKCNDSGMLPNGRFCNKCGR